MLVCPQCLTRSAEAGRCSADAALLLPLGVGDPRLGSVIGDRYLLLEVLGRGGMGVIYRAHQRTTQGSVAIKVITGDGPGVGEAIARLEREARCTAQMLSPHTVRVFDSGLLPDGSAYLVMELLKGRSLAAIIEEEGPLPQERARAIIEQIFLSLEEAHGQGLVHRDIKPSNVMVQGLGSGGEHVKVLDFGLVRSFQEDHSRELTQAGSFFGTPPYMAPELWSADHGMVGPETDIYALGVLIHFLFSGRRPFEATSMAGYLNAHLHQAPTPLSAHLDAPFVPTLAQVILRCLAKSPVDRPESIDAVRTLLREALEPQRAGEAALEGTLPLTPSRRALPGLAPTNHGAGLGKSRRPALLFGAWALVAGAATPLCVDRLLARPPPTKSDLREVVIRSSPPGAEVLLDGTPTGRATPAVIGGLPSGTTCRIGLQRPGYQPFEELASIDQRRELSVTLRPLREPPP